MIAVGSLQGCFLGDDDRAPAPQPSSCAESRPQIFALDMSPSGVVGTSGDYEVAGTIRYSCSVVSVQAHVLSNDANVRWAPDPSGKESQNLSLRFAGSLKGHTVQYEVSVFDAQGNQSSPSLRESVSLE